MTIEDKINNLFKDQFPEVELGLAKGEFGWLKTDLVEIVKKEISNALDMIVLERKDSKHFGHIITDEGDFCLSCQDFTGNNAYAVDSYNHAIDDLQAKIAKIKEERKL